MNFPVFIVLLLLQHVVGVSLSQLLVGKLGCSYPEVFG